MRVQQIVAVARVAASEPGRRWGMILLALFGALAAFGTAGCMGCGQVTLQGQQLAGADRIAAAEAVGVGLVSIYTLLALSLIAMGLFTGELARGAASFALSRALPRWAYLAGRALAGVAPAVAIPLAAGLSYAGTFAWSSGGSVPWGFVEAFLVLILGWVAFLWLAGLLNLFLPGVFASALAAAAYVGSVLVASGTITAAVSSATSWWVKPLHVSIQAVLPPFGRLHDLATALRTDEGVAWADAMALPWLAGYLCLFMLLAARSFRRRDL